MTVVDERVIQRNPGWRDALRSSWLMDGPQDRGALLGVEASSALRFADFPTGRVIFAEGDAVERVYVIVSGMVKITGSVGRARPVVRALLGPGDVLDEAAVFDTDPHSVTATSQSLVRTGWLDKADVHQMLVRRPRLALEWLRALARCFRTPTARFSSFADART